MRGKSRDPGADGHPAGHSRELEALDHAPQFFGDGEGLLRVGLGQQDRKFFSAVAAHHINLAQLLVEQRRNLAQDLVPQQVAELIIQPLELVDVRHDHGHAGSVAAGALDFFHDPQLEKAPVKDSGQAVEVGQLFDPLHVVRVLDGVGANVGDRFQRLQFALAESVGLRRCAG